MNSAQQPRLRRLQWGEMHGCFTREDAHPPVRSMKLDAIIDAGHGFQATSRRAASCSPRNGQLLADFSQEAPDQLGVVVHTASGESLDPGAHRFDQANSLGATEQSKRACHFEAD